MREHSAAPTPFLWHRLQAQAKTVPEDAHEYNARRALNDAAYQSLQVRR